MTKKKILIATGGTGGTFIPLKFSKLFRKKTYNVKLTSDARGLNILKIIKILI